MLSFSWLRITFCWSYFWVVLCKTQLEVEASECICLDVLYAIKPPISIYFLILFHWNACVFAIFFSIQTPAGGHNSPAGGLHPNLPLFITISHSLRDTVPLHYQHSNHSSPSPPSCPFGTQSHSFVILKPMIRLWGHFSYNFSLLSFIKTGLSSLYVCKLISHGPTPWRRDVFP